jgi:hypothetical protein
MAPATEAPPRRSEERSRPRVGFSSERARRWLGGEPSELELEVAGAAPELVVLDAADERPRPELERIAAAARARGARLVGLSLAAGTERLAGLVDVVLSDGSGRARDAATLRAPRPFDPRRLNPIGFRQAEVAGLLCVVPEAATRAALSEALAELAQIAREEPVALCARPEQLPTALPGGIARVAPPAGEAERRALLHAHLGVLDHAALHRSEAERASALVRLAALGVPVHAPALSAATSELLGAELAAALTGTGLDDIVELDRRERASVAARRAAHRHHTREALWRRLAGAASLAWPERARVSCILSTRRESWLAHGVEQVMRQSYRPRELVVCLHGEEFSDGVEERLRAQVAGAALEILRPDPALSLGEALNAGVERASGEYVTKMDDDDYYSRDHLWDLALALEYSGAELCGKAAEFVYLETMDLTLRRFMGDVETDNQRLAGGGMMARREPLRSLGGWPARSRGEDTVLIKTFRQAGRRVHRTHGYGYILNRHMRGHTWNTYVDYFLVQSEREWRGLRFDESGVDS